MSIKTSQNYSPNFSTRRRNLKKIKYIVYHYTGMRSESKAIKRLTDDRAKVSCHYFIKRNGQIILMVPELYEAWHAGKSKWKKFDLLNKYSIGIEINNPGHDFGYNKFNSKQINSLKKLLSFLIKKYNIKADNVLGHSDIAPDRKKDPGEKFPWKKLAKKRLCKWHNLNRKKIKKFRGISISANEKKAFLNNLSKICYNLKIKKIFDKNTRFIIIAYQRHFRQELIDGKIDKECLLISKNLIKS